MFLATKSINSRSAINLLLLITSPPKKSGKHGTETPILQCWTQGIHRIFQWVFWELYLSNLRSSTLNRVLLSASLMGLLKKKFLNERRNGFEHPWKKVFSACAHTGMDNELLLGYPRTGKAGMIMELRIPSDFPPSSSSSSLPEL